VPAEVDPNRLILQYTLQVVDAALATAHLHASVGHGESLCDLLKLLVVVEWRDELVLGVGRLGNLVAHHQRASKQES
jgi:hypothetical protein